MRLVLAASVDALPTGSAAAFDDTADFFSTFAWWRTVCMAGIPDGGAACFALAQRDGASRVLVPLLRGDHGRSLEALTNPYTCLYQPLMATDAGPADLRGTGRALAGLARWLPGLRLDALAEDWPGLAPLLAGARRGGLVPLRFRHFGNWHEPIGGRGWDAYLADRPGALRETIRRRLRAAARDPSVSWHVATTPAEAEEGIRDYEAVYARSWKEPEPFPAFNATLMRAAAALGALRLGILRVNGQPIAVQLWIVWRGRAAVLKLAHDEAFKPLSPGTVLTARMIARLLDEERISELDFGRGDDPYKRAWAGTRRQRIGIMLANPLHPRGWALIARHAAGSLRRRLAGTGSDQPHGDAAAG